MRKVLVHALTTSHDCEDCGLDMNVLYTISGDLGNHEMGGYAACFGQDRDDPEEVYKWIGRQVDPLFDFSYQECEWGGTDDNPVVISQIPATICQKEIEGDVSCEVLKRYLEKELDVEVEWLFENDVDTWSDDECWEDC